MVEPISFWGEHFHAVNRESLSAHAVTFYAPLGVSVWRVCTQFLRIPLFSFSSISQSLFVLPGDFYYTLIKQSRFTTSMRSMQLQSLVVLCFLVFGMTKCEPHTKCHVLLILANIKKLSVFSLPVLLLGGSTLSPTLPYKDLVRPEVHQKL